MGRKAVRDRTSDLRAQGLELEDTLEQEPRLLLDPCFLGALHAELPEQLGPEEGRAALFQLGFLHGLRDAIRVLRADPAASHVAPPHVPATPRLVLELQPGRDGDALLLEGGWPDRLEAGAHVATLGRSERNACDVSAGYTSGWLSGLFDREVIVVETLCAARGEEACRFVAREAETWRARRDAQAAARLRAVDFDALRAAVERHLPAPPAEEPGRFDPSSPAIHVWGPVMILPYCGPDECLRAVELIGRDPDARQVSVVVLDLGGTWIDEGLGAAALEQVLDAIEGFGAEAVVTGVSTLSERTVADLERSPVLVAKTLAEAIAAGFQIATLQERVA